MSTVAAAHISKTETRPDEANRTLAVAALGTLLVLAVFSAVVTTVGDSNRALHGGVSSQTWTLSGMSLGLAATLLTVGALADDLGRRRVLAVSSALLAVFSALARRRPEHRRARRRTDPAGRRRRRHRRREPRRDRARLPDRSPPDTRHQRLGLRGRRRHRDRTARRRRAVGVGWVAEQLLAPGDRRRGAGAGGRAAAGVALIDEAGTRSLRRRRVGGRDGLPDRRADRGSRQLVGTGDDRPAGRRSRARGGVRGDRSAQARADARARPIHPPAVPGLAERRPVHRLGGDRPDELHPARCFSAAST